MLADLYFNSCIQCWTFFAQATAPTAAKAASQAATHATPATNATAAVPAAPPLGGVPQVDYVPPAHHAVVFGVLHGLTLFVYFVICVALIICVLFQTTKNEGLSGVIGGASTTSLFRGKKSAEETLSLWTTRLAVSFVIFSLFIWILFSRTGGG